MRPGGILIILIILLVHFTTNHSRLFRRGRFFGRRSAPTDARQAPTGLLWDENHPSTGMIWPRLGFSEASLGPLGSVSWASQKHLLGGAEGVQNLGKCSV